MKPPVAYLRECLRLDKRTGKLFWLNRPLRHFKTRDAWRSFNTRFSGCEAGSLDAHGYRQLTLTGQVIKGHQAVFALMHGEWPTRELDHWNRNRADNRPNNLKLAGRSEQSQNAGMRSVNTSGYRGVSWHKKARRWEVHIQANGQQFYLGLFDDPAVAYSTYLAAKAQHHTYQPEVRS